MKNFQTQWWEIENMGFWKKNNIFFDEKKKFFLKLEIFFDYSFDAEKPELSIGAIFSAIRASFIG